MILVESSAHANKAISVEDALQNLVEAAVASTDGYTVEQLTEMVREELALHEAGGLVSWLVRYVSGSDKSLVDDLKEEIKGIKTEDEREKTLKDIDKFIKQAEGVTVGQVLAFLFSPLGSPPMWPIIAVARIIKKQNGTTDDYVKAMKLLRAEVSSMKL